MENQLSHGVRGEGIANKFGANTLHTHTLWIASNLFIARYSKHAIYVVQTVSCDVMPISPLWFSPNSKRKIKRKYALLTLTFDTTAQTRNF